MQIGTRANETQLLENPEAGDILGMHDGNQTFDLETSEPEVGKCGGRLRREAPAPDVGGVAVEELDLLGLGKGLKAAVSDHLVGSAFDDRAGTQPRLGDAIDLFPKAAVRLRPIEHTACEAAGLWIRVDGVRGVQVTFVEGTNDEAPGRDGIEREHRLG